MSTTRPDLDDEMAVVVAHSFPRSEKMRAALESGLAKLARFAETMADNGNSRDELLALRYLLVRQVIRIEERTGNDAIPKATP